MKKFFLMGLVVLSCFFVVCGCGKEKTEDKKDNNVKEETVGLGPYSLKMGDLENAKITNELELTETKFETSSTRTSFHTTIVNNSDKNIKVYELHIIIRDKAGNEMVTFRVRIDNLAVGESKTFETAMDSPLTNYSTVEYKLIETEQDAQ